MVEGFDTNWIATLGKSITEFEDELAEKVGSKTATALSLGKAAIYMVLKVVGLGKGDIVMVA